MEKKGETAGAECGMFYGSYVFFEKMRIWEGKGKGVRRVRSEVEYVFFPSLLDRLRGMFANDNWVDSRMEDL